MYCMTDLESWPEHRLSCLTFCLGINRAMK
jgi:hypothetical protein